MSHLRFLLLPVAASLLLAACGKEGADDAVTPPAGTPSAAVQPTPPPLPVDPPATAVQPTTVSADAVTIGTKLQGDMVVKSASPQFSTSDTVLAGASVKGKPAGAEVAVYWTYEDGRTHKEERRKLAGEQYVSFSFGKIDGMKAGKYNAQIDVDMVPVGITDFVVK